MEAGYERGAGGGQRERKEPERRRGEAGVIAVPGESEGSGVRREEPQRADEHEQRDDERKKVPRSRGAEDGESRRTDEKAALTREGDQNRLGTCEPRIELGGDDERRGVGPKIERVATGRHVVDLKEDERGSGNVRKHRCVAEGTRECIRDEPPVAEKRAHPHSGSRNAGRERTGPNRSAKRGVLRNSANDGDEERSTDRRLDPENRPPPDGREQHAAEARRDDRGDPHYQDKARKKPGRDGRIVAAIAHERAGNHHREGASERLESPGGNQRPERRRDRARERTTRVEGEPDKERRPPAKLIGDRPCRELSKRERGKEARQRRRDCCGRTVEIGRNRRKCRHIHVDRERRYPGERAKEGDEARRHRIRRDAGSTSSLSAR